MCLINNIQFLQCRKNDIGETSRNLKFPIYLYKSTFTLNLLCNTKKKKSYNLDFINATQIRKEHKSLHRKYFEGILSISGSINSRQRQIIVSPTNIKCKLKKSKIYLPTATTNVIKVFLPQHQARMKIISRRVGVLDTLTNEYIL